MLAPEAGPFRGTEAKGRTVRRWFAGRAGRSLALALAVALAVGGCASSTVVAPRWASVPDGLAMGDAYPGFAADAGIEGAARLACVITPIGRLTDCAVLASSPEGLGFGQAALELAPLFVAEPVELNGVRRASRAEFNIVFALPPIDLVPPWTGPEPSTETMALAREVSRRAPRSLVRGPNAVKTDGVAEDRRADVEQIVAQVDAESRAEMIEAAAWALARTQSHANLALLTQGQRRPSRPNLSDDQIERARDRIAHATQRQNARLRELYCARYDCSRRPLHGRR